jgi:hypothetical protein
MRIPNVIMIAMLSAVPSYIFSQEIPDLPRETLQKFTPILNDANKKLVEAQMKLANFTGDTDSEEYQALNDDIEQKQQEFFESISKDKNPDEQIEQEQPVEEATSEHIEQPKELTAAIESIPIEQEPAEQQLFEAEPMEEQALEDQSMEEVSTEPQAIEIPAVPEPTIEDASMATDENSSESPLGIDTVSLEDPQGNWLFKRIWWERAEDRYEKIRNLVSTIWESRTQFFIKRNELDKEVLNPFYTNTGMTRGELQIILGDIIDLFEKQREQEGDLTEEEREEFEKVAAEQDSLKQLKMDVDSIANLDSAIDKALEKLMDQINDARNLETQAWKNFKEIAHILNDTKARELYYMIEGAARNIKNISTYLEQSFLTHFDTLIQETKSHIKKVQARMQALKEKGVSFKSQAEQMALQQEQEKQQAEEEEAAEQEEENKPKQKTGWINWIVSSLQKALNFAISIIRLPYDMIFGKK